MTTKHEMPALTDEQRQALIVWLRNEINLIQSAQDEIPFGLDYDGEMALESYKITLAALEAEPVYWEIAGQLFSTKEEAMKPGYRGTPEPLFEEAPVPVLKPLVLKGGSLKPDGKFWYSEDTVREIIRDAGYPVEGEDNATTE